MKQTRTRTGASREGAGPRGFWVFQTSPFEKKGIEITPEGDIKIWGTPQDIVKAVERHTAEAKARDKRHAHELAVRNEQLEELLLLFKPAARDELRNSTRKTAEACISGLERGRAPE